MTDLCFWPHPICCCIAQSTALRAFLSKEEGVYIGQNRHKYAVLRLYGFECYVQGLLRWHIWSPERI